MTTTLEQFCDDWLASWTGNRPEPLLDWYAPDARYVDPSCPDGLSGHAQMRPYFTKLLARYPDWVWRREELMPTAAGFTLKWRARLADGSVFRGLDIVELRDGRISRNEVYFDPAPMRRAQGAGVYIVNNMNLRDREAYAAYLRGFMKVFRSHGGEVLAAVDGPQPLEGRWPFERTVLLRLPTRAHAQRWIESPEYQAILPHRHRGADSNIAMLDGFDPGAPGTGS